MINGLVPPKQLPNSPQNKWNSSYSPAASSSLVPVSTNAFPMRSSVDCSLSKLTAGSDGYALQSTPCSLKPRKCLETTCASAESGWIVPALHETHATSSFPSHLAHKLTTRPILILKFPSR